MSPTLFRWKNYRFFFFSREEARMHVHVSCADGEAKFWLEPIVSFAMNKGMSMKQLREVNRIVEDKRNEIIKAWKKHFSG